MYTNQYAFVLLGVLTSEFASRSVRGENNKERTRNAPIADFHHPLTPATLLSFSIHLGSSGSILPSSFKVGELRERALAPSMVHKRILASKASLFLM